MLNPSLPEQYKPKDNHPWRRYKNKLNKNGQEEESAPPKPSLRVFLINLATNYDSFQIDAEDNLEGSYQAIKSMSDDKVAAWLISFMRRNWLSNSKEAIVIE